MLTEDGCLTRRTRLWNTVPDDVEWLLIADPRHVHYLSSFWVNPLSFSTCERGLLLLERDGPATLLADNFTRRSAVGAPFVDNEVIENWYDHRHSVVNRDHALFAAVNSISERISGRLGATECEWLPAPAAGQITSQQSVAGDVNLGPTLRELRRRKESDEIALLQECMRAGDTGHARAREVVAAGVTEFDIYREVQSAAMKAAGRPALVYGDFRAVNARTPKAGGLPTDYRLRDGDLMILDFSVVIDGYRSDFTNTVCVGTPTDDQQQLYDTCCAAMRRGEKSLKPGAKARDVYAATSSALEDAGFGSLGHHAGHGIGLGHPEPPILVPESDDDLREGDVVTLEPGIYVEGIGGMRFEHNYLITESGFQRLSNHVLSLK